MRSYTRHSVFCIDLPTFVNSSVNPSSFESAPAMVAITPRVLSLLAILELSTDSSTRLLYHESWVWLGLSSTLQQTSAGFTDQKLRKENTTLKKKKKKRSTFSWPKRMSMVLPSFWNQTAVEWSFLICCGMLTSTLPILLVLKSRLLVWDLYGNVSPLSVCRSGEHAFSALLQIIHTPYWILRRLRYGDPVKPRNCILSFHTWFPPLSPVFEETAHFLLWMRSPFPESVCWSHPRP